MDWNESSVAPFFQTHVTASAPVLLGDSAAVGDLRDQIARVAGLNVTVLIEGAIGTGKSAVARVIHHASRRRFGPFVARACGDLDPEKAASAFFGHCRGAFDGACLAHRRHVDSISDHAMQYLLARAWPENIAS